jgi:hypothetical protein
MQKEPIHPQIQGQQQHYTAQNQMMYHNISSSSQMAPGTPMYSAQQPAQVRQHTPMHSSRVVQYNAQPYIGNASYSPNQRNEGQMSNYAPHFMQQQQTYAMNASTSPYAQQFHNNSYTTSPRNYQHQPIVYIPATTGGYPGGVVTQMQMQQNSVSHISNQNLYTANQIQQSSSQQHGQHPIQMQQHTASTTEKTPTKKKGGIVIKDPNTGKDITNELRNSSKKAAAPKSSIVPRVASPPLTQQNEDQKAKIQAAFAAQVAAVASSPARPFPSVKVNDEKTTNASETVALPKTDDSAKVIDPSKSDDTLKTVDALKKTETKIIESEETAVETSADITDAKQEISETKKITQENAVNVTTQDNVVQSLENKMSEVKIEEDSKAEKTVEEIVRPVISAEKLIVEEPVIEQKEIITECSVEVSNMEELETIPNGNSEGENIGAAFAVAKKKKGKNRFKDKDVNNDDMLSAFTDEPLEAEPVVIADPEPAKVSEKLPEDATWEDKEKTIEKEEIRSEDAEEPEAVPKFLDIKIIKSEDSPTTEEEKLQYDREFLLKFQFASICTSKPLGLPDIDIVLSEAHAPTKALIQGQRIASSNDFMPPFMRQVSGNRSSGSGKPRGGRGSQGGQGGQGGGRQGGGSQKVITISLPFEKIELHKSDNAWKPQSVQLKEMPEEERVMAELERNILSILNKLTPQKFKPLVEKMMALNIDTDEKLTKTIDLIFEKAVTEPGFSVAYANMCKVLNDALI